MALYRHWEWATDWEDLRVTASSEDIVWSADMAYYPGKPSQDSICQSHAEFLANGPPHSFNSMPDGMLNELRDAIRQAGGENAVR